MTTTTTNDKLTMDEVKERANNAAMELAEDIISLYEAKGKDFGNHRIDALMEVCEYFLSHLFDAAGDPHIPGIIEHHRDLARTHILSLHHPGEVTTRG